MHRSLRVLPLLASAAAAQPSLPGSLGPNNADLNADASAPLMGSGSRIQQLYELTEIGGSGSRPLTIGGVALRFDGPSGGPLAVSHRIDRLTIRIGATHRSVDQVGAVFDGNLTQPLQTALDVVDYRWVSDARSVAGPEPWGGPGDQLRFRFPQPVEVTVPVGGSFVLELVTRGNSNPIGGDTARLDCSHELAAVVRPGWEWSSGAGCGFNDFGEQASLATLGQYEPGTAFFTAGAGYTPGAPVFTFLTSGLLPLVWFIPGTPACWLYVDPSTGFISNSTTANAKGEAGGGIPIPRSPVMSGAKLYVQNVGLVRPNQTNPAGVVASNYRTVEVGETAPPMVRAWHASSDRGPDEDLATLSRAGGLALRLE